MSGLKKYAALCIAVLLGLTGLGVQAEEPTAYPAAEQDTVVAAASSQDVWSETEQIDYDAMTVTTAKLFIDEFLGAISVPTAYTAEVLDETGAVKTRGEIYSNYKLRVTDAAGVVCADFDIIQTVQGVYSLTSSQYKINEKAQTITGIPYSDMRIEDFLSHLEMTPDTTVEVLRPDKSPLYGDMYPGCLLRAYTIYEEHIYTLDFNPLEVNPNADLALKKPVTGNAGTWQGNYVPQNLTSGVVTGSNMWGAKDNGAYAEIDLGASLYFNKLQLIMHSGNREAFREMNIYCDNTPTQHNDPAPQPDDGELIASIISDGKNGVPEETVTFTFEEPKYARYITLVHKEKQNGKNPWIREVEVYATENYNCGISSDKYSVDNQNALISEVDTNDLAEILSNVSPLHNSSLSLVDADGNALDGGEYQEGCAVRCTSESGTRYKDFVISTNLRPQVTGLTVTGSMAVGKTLSAQGRYASPSNLPEDRIEYQWCRSVKAEGPFIPIQGAVGETYTVRSEDAGYYICARATAYSTEEPAEGAPVFSDFCGLVGDYAFGAQTQVGSSAAAALVDGDASTAYPLEKGDSLTVNMGSAAKFNHVLLSFSGDVSDTEFVVDYSQNGSSWQRLSTLFGRDRQMEVWFEPIQAQYIKIGVNKGDGLSASALTVNRARLREAEERAAFALTKQLLDDYFKTIDADTTGFIVPNLGINGAALSWSSKSPCFSLNGEQVTVTKPDAETRAALAVRIVTPYEDSAETYSIPLNGTKPPASTQKPGSVSSGGSSGSGGKKTNYQAPIASAPILPQSPQQPAKPADTDASFGDIATHWAKEDIAYLCTKGIVAKDESFRPNDSITRAEFAKLCAAMMGWTGSEAALFFSDVPSGAWSRPYVAALYEKGIINGKSEDYFGAEEAITRQEAAVILYRAQQAAGKQLAAGEADFADKQEIAGYALEAVSAMAQQGILKGNDSGEFAPGMNITRAEAAAVIARLLRA